MYAFQFRGSSGIQETGKRTRVPGLWFKRTDDCQVSGDVVGYNCRFDGGPSFRTGMNRQCWPSVAIRMTPCINVNKGGTLVGRFPCQGQF